MAEEEKRWPWSKPAPTPTDPPGLLNGNDGQSLGKSLPPWPMSEIPSFREDDQLPRATKDFPLPK